MPVLPTSREVTRFFHGLERGLAEVRANLRTVSETYVRIAYDRPWESPAPKPSSTASTAA